MPAGRNKYEVIKISLHLNKGNDNVLITTVMRYKKGQKLSKMTQQT